MAKKKTVCNRCFAAQMREHLKNKKVDVPVVVIRFRRRSLGLHRPEKKRAET